MIESVWPDDTQRQVAKTRASSFDLSEPSQQGKVVKVLRLTRIVLNTVDAAALARFYVDVLAFAPLPDADAQAGTIALQLGGVRLDLRQVDAASTRYPPDVAGWSPLFQHCAIVVSDMARAMRTLLASAAWSPISTDGPQALPANTGHVTAFKFRDPEGHPLELLAFPGAPARDGTPFVRIDHTALSVTDVDRSIAFYERLGLVVGGRSLNSGIEQECLDAIVGATVDVVSLVLPSRSVPHVELLGYHGTHDRGRLTRLQIDDVAATRLVFEGVVDGHGLATHGLLQDPDGHFVEIAA